MEQNSAGDGEAAAGMGKRAAVPGAENGLDGRRKGGNVQGYKTDNWKKGKSMKNMGSGRIGKNTKSGKNRKRQAKWRKELDKQTAQIIKEKAKTKRACEKVRRKAAKARKKKVEKTFDRLLAGTCFLICLAAALKDAQDRRKNK